MKISLGKASAEITKKGAHVVSWIEEGGTEQLYISPTTSFESEAAIRGGIPVIFPQFADQGELAKHGFMRTSTEWETLEKKESSITMIHRATEATKKLWNHNFEFLYTVALLDNGNQLRCDITIKNTNSEDQGSFSAQVCLHTYFAISSIENIRVSGLQGSSYIDKLNANNEVLENNEHITIKEEVDRIYKDVKGSVTLIDNSGKNSLMIDRENMQDIVLWNPWINKAASMEDLPDDGYKSFVCIESGQIHERFEVLAQSSLSFSQTLQVQRPSNKL